MQDLSYTLEYHNVTDIIEYLEQFPDQGGPFDMVNTQLGLQGCSDRYLGFDDPHSPVHCLVSKLKEDYGDFHIYSASHRTMFYPFMPHTDIRSQEFIRKARADGFTEGYSFLIPLSWQDNYLPGTVFFNNPAKIEEDLYDDRPDILVPYVKEVYDKTAMNLSVRKVIDWENPGDLIAWKNFMWHSSKYDSNWNYSKDNWCKKFLNIETWRHIS
jgi:hypothetical protein